MSALADQPHRQRVGILGGGQLGRMMLQAGLDYDVDFCVLDPSPEAPCHRACEFTCGSLTDAATVVAFGKSMDAVTIEIEDVSVEGMRQLEDLGVRVVPSSAHVQLIQDKGLQKTFFKAKDIPTAAFTISHTLTSFPVVQKVRRGGFDGRGVKVLRSEEDEPLSKEACVLEELIQIRKEVSVIVARTANETKAFPAAESVFDARANVASIVACPPSPDVSSRTLAECEAIAKRVADELDFIGLLAVELFVTHQDEVLVNEIAPRCHNSGHHTIEANATSQFSQLLRVVLNLPLGDVTATRPFAATVNILGDADTPKGSPASYAGVEDALKLPGVYLHLYGKASVSPFRKMGHLTVCGHDRDAVLALAARLKAQVKCRFLDVSAPPPLLS